MILLKLIQYGIGKYKEDKIFWNNGIKLFLVIMNQVGDSSKWWTMSRGQY
jgi:hypothetical protein